MASERTAMHSQVAAPRAPYSPAPAEYLAQLPAIRRALLHALELLEADPNPARVGAAGLQVGGLSLFLTKWAGAMKTEADAKAGEGHE
jgi:hypothetical protein